MHGFENIPPIPMNTDAPEIICRSLRLPRALDRQLRLLAAEHEQSIHAAILDAIGAAVQPRANALPTPNQESK